MERPTYMDHTEAISQMATERYLLDELSPELRDAYEEHLFDCPECTLDLRAAEAFVNEAKTQLPEITAPFRDKSLRRQTSTETTGRKSPFHWLRPLFANPAFAAPAFATLLLILGYQNFVTYPELKSEINEPSIQPWTSIHAATRGGGEVPIQADPVQGVMLLLDLSQQPEYVSYSFDLSDSNGKSIWTEAISAAQAASHEGTVSLRIPGSKIRQGTYALSVFGINIGNQQTPVEHHTLRIQKGTP